MLSKWSDTERLVQSDTGTGILTVPHGPENQGQHKKHRSRKSSFGARRWGSHQRMERQQDPGEKFLHPDKPLHQCSNPYQTISDRIRKGPGLMGNPLLDDFRPPREETGKRDRESAWKELYFAEALSLPRELNKHLVPESEKK